MDQQPQRIVIRIRRRRRMTFLIAFILIILLFISMPISISIAYHDLEDLSDLSSTYFEPFFLGIFLLFLIGGTYVVALWWSYRIVLDEEGIAREGLPHGTFHRGKIAYGDIERVTYGTRHVIRIIPHQGQVLALNCQHLEVEPKVLIDILRQRIGAERVDSDLEKTIAKRRKPEWLEWAMVVMVIPMIFVMLKYEEISNKTIGRLAWETVFKEGRDTIALDETQDGTIWLLTEGIAGEDLLGIRLYRIQGDQTDWIDLPRDPILHENLQPYAGYPWYVRSMVVDADNRLWFLFDPQDALYLWQDGTWSQYQPKVGEQAVPMYTLAPIGEDIWILSQSMLLRFQPESGETEEFLLWGARFEGDPGDTLNPSRMYRTNDGGMIVTGTLMTSGSDGFVHFNQDGIVDLMVELDESETVPDPSWHLNYAGTDADGNVYFFYAPWTSCAEGKFSVIVERYDREGKEWSRTMVRREMDCEWASSFPSYAVDPRGRIWLEKHWGKGDGVMVYEQEVFDTGLDSPPQAPYRHYTRWNSGYNGESLTALPTGHIYAMSQYDGDIVRIDATVEHLPRHAPEWLVEGGWGMIVATSPFLILAIAWLYLYVRRNLRRD
jgi:hypothetical protein